MTLVRWFIDGCVIQSAQAAARPQPVWLHMRPLRQGAAIQGHPGGSHTQRALRREGLQV